MRALWRVVLLLVVLSAPAAVDAQPRRLPPPTPPPEGQRITASDGDTVVIEGDARVRIIRRRPAFVRIVANTEHGFVIILTENLREYGDSPNRLSDRTYEFNGIQGEFPFAARWEGPVWLEEYSSGGSPPGGFSGMLGLETSEGTIVFTSGRAEPSTANEPKTMTVAFHGVGIGGGGQQPFDQEEARALAMAQQNAARRAQGAAPITSGAGFSAWTSSISAGPVGPARGAAPALDGAVRVGGNVAPPQKIRDVQPQLPDQARAARISGTVIIEITIGPDGVVTDARVLRSIPLLDQAALDAVRQWRYAPLLLNGSPVPVIMTVTVSFNPA